MPLQRRIHVTFLTRNGRAGGKQCTTELNLLGTRDSSALTVNEYHLFPLDTWMFEDGTSAVVLGGELPTRYIIRGSDYERLLHRDMSGEADDTGLLEVRLQEITLFPVQLLGEESNLWLMELDEQKNLQEGKAERPALEVQLLTYHTAYRLKYSFVAHLPKTYGQCSARTLAHLLRERGELVDGKEPSGKSDKGHMLEQLIACEKRSIGYKDPETIVHVWAEMHILFGPLPVFNEFLYEMAHVSWYDLEKRMVLRNAFEQQAEKALRAEGEDLQYLARKGESWGGVSSQAISFRVAVCFKLLSAYTRAAFASYETLIQKQQGQVPWNS